MRSVVILAGCIFVCGSARAAEKQDEQTIKASFHFGPPGVGGVKKAVVTLTWDYHFSKWQSGQGTLHIEAAGVKAGDKSTVTKTSPASFGGLMTTTFARSKTNHPLYDGLLCGKITEVTIYGMGREGPKSGPLKAPPLKNAKVIVDGADLAQLKNGHCKP